MKQHVDSGLGFGYRRAKSFAFGFEVGSVAYRLSTSFYQLMVWNYLNEVVGTICQGLVYCDEVILVISLWSKLLVGALILPPPKMTKELEKVGQPDGQYIDAIHHLILAPLHLLGLTTLVWWIHLAFQAKNEKFIWGQSSNPVWKRSSKDHTYQLISKNQIFAKEMWVAHPFDVIWKV